MRNPPEAPLVDLPPGANPAATISVAAADLPLRQQFVAGTTAHNVAMGRRLPVEAVNSDLKGRFVNVNRGFCQVYGTTKILILLGFTVAGLNMRITKRFRALLARLAGPPRTPTRRTRRRRGRYADIAAVSSMPTAGPVRGPPPEGR